MKGHFILDVLQLKVLSLQHCLTRGTRVIHIYILTEEINMIYTVKLYNTYLLSQPFLQSFCILRTYHYWEANYQINIIENPSSIWTIELSIHLYPCGIDVHQNCLPSCVVISDCNRLSWRTAVIGFKVQSGMGSGIVLYL